MSDASYYPLCTLTGTVAPEGAIVAELGSLYLRQTSPTTSQIYQKTSQQVASVPDAIGWEELVPGGTPNAPNIWDVPSTPSPDDDEFLSNTLDPAWQSAGWSAGGINPYDVAFNAGDVRYELNTARRRSWLMVQTPADAVLKRLMKPITAPVNANEFFYMRGNFNTRRLSTPANDSIVGLMLSTNPFDMNNRIELYLNEQDANVMQMEFVKTEAGIQTSVTTSLNVGAGAIQPIEAVGMQKIGNTYHAWGFTSSGQGLYLAPTNFAPVLGTMGLMVLNATTGQPGTQIVGFDFIRRVSSALWLP